MTRIAQLQSEADAFARKVCCRFFEGVSRLPPLALQIELEKRRIGFVEMKADEVRDKIDRVRQSMGGINASRECDRSLEKQVKILENRLEKSYRSYSEVGALHKRAVIFETTGV